MSHDNVSSGDSIVLVTPPPEILGSSTNPLPQGAITATTESAPTFSVDVTSTRPRPSRCNSSYRELAFKDPLREEEDIDHGDLPSLSLTAYDQFYQDLAARPSDDFLQALRDGPPDEPTVKARSTPRDVQTNTTEGTALTAYDEYYRDLAAKPSDDFLQALRDGPPDEPNMDLRALSNDHDIPMTNLNSRRRTRQSSTELRNAGSTQLVRAPSTETAPTRRFLPTIPSLFKLGIPLPRRKSSYDQGVSKPAAVVQPPLHNKGRERGSNPESQGPNGMGLGNLPGSPETMADRVRRSAAGEATWFVGRDGTGWRQQRALFGSTETDEQARAREQATVEAWKEWTALCVATNAIMTDYARQSQSSSSRTESKTSSESQPDIVALAVPVEGDPLSLAALLAVSVDESGTAPRHLRTSSPRGMRRMSAALPSFPNHVYHGASSASWTGQQSPSWTGQQSPSWPDGVDTAFDSFFPADAVDRSRAPVIPQRRNPLLPIRARLANKQIRQLVIELAHTMAHLVHDSFAIRGRIALTARLDTTDVKGNRRRSDILTYLRKPESAVEASPAPSPSMVEWYAREAAAMMIDLDEALGSSNTFTHLIDVAGYVLVPANNPTSMDPAASDDLQLLVDLEELVWGLVDVPPDDLRGAII